MNQQFSMMRLPKSLDARLIGGLVAASAATLFLSGCGGKDVFAKVNGQVITKEEYLHALEHTNLGAQAGQTNAERFVIDQLITNKIIMSEAAKENVVPADETVNAYYNYQQKLYQETMPQGKDFETNQREQGTTPDETKANLKNQLAEMALYAKKMNVTDADIRKVYDKANGQFGLPARVLMRLILVAPNSPDFARAKQMIDSKQDFAAVAKEVNVAQLRGMAGLLPTYTMMNQMAPDLQQKVAKANTGDIIGPIDYKYAANQSPAKAWIKIEDKRPPYNIAFDDAAPLIRQQVVQIQIQQPQYAGIRNEIIKQKLDASFEPTDASYTTVWNAIKKTAEAAGIGQAAPVVSTAPAPMGAPAPAPVTAPAAAPAKK